MFSISGRKTLRRFHPKKVEAREDGKVRVNYIGKVYKPVDLAVSVEYMKSDAFKDVYGDQPIWHYYRRNFKGHFFPNKPRSPCVSRGAITTLNPCPICRDDHLVLHHLNIELLLMCVDEVEYNAFSYKVLNFCSRQLKKLLFEVEVAKDLGLLPVRLPFRFYNYHDHFTADIADQLSVDFEKAVIPYANALPAAEFVMPPERPRIPNRYCMVEGPRLRGRRLKERYDFEFAQRERRLSAQRAITIEPLPRIRPLREADDD